MRTKAVSGQHSALSRRLSAFTGRLVSAGRALVGARDSAGPPKPVRLGTTAFAADTLSHAAREFARGLTPEKIAGIFDNAEDYIDEQIVLAAQFEETDDHLNGTLALRRAAVLRLDTTITAGDPDDQRSADAAELARAISAAPWFHNAREYLLRAILQQHTAIEIFYSQAASGPWMPFGFRAVEPERWNFARPEGGGDPVVRLRKHTYDSSEWIEPQPGQFVLHNCGAVAGQPGRYAVVRAVAKLAYLGRLALVEWGGLVDSWFQPFTHVTYRDGLSAAEIQTMVDAMIELASRKVAATPEGTTVTLHDIPDQTPHKDFQDFVRRAESILLLGQDTAQQALDGQQTGSMIQGDVRDDIRDADARALDATLNEQLFAPWCAWNFGPDVVPPQISHTIHESVDPEQRGRIYLQARDLGLPVKRSQVYEDLAIEQPGEDDELLGGAVSLQPSAVSPIPVPGGNHAFQGMQIGPAIEILVKVREGVVNEYAATELLMALGFARETAAAMAAEAVSARPVPAKVNDAATRDGGAGDDDDVTTAAGRGRAHVLASGGAAGLFAGLTEAVRSLAEQCSTLDEFRDRLPELVQSGGAELDAALELATFGNYCAGRLATAAQLAAKAVGGQPSAFGRQESRAVAILAEASAGVVERARFVEAIDQMAQRTDLLPKDQFLALHGLNRARAWTVARVAEVDLLKDLHDAVGQAIEGGQSWREFKDSLDHIMEQRGWSGLEPWHAKIVYEQNVNMAWSAGRTMQAQDAGVRHWRKLPSQSLAPRPEHQRYDNQVFTFEQMTPPPWGFGCKCEWEPVFDEEITGETPVPRISGPADQPPAGGEFEWNASHYYRPLELRQGDYPETLWGVIESLASDANALLKLRK